MNPTIHISFIEGAIPLSNLESLCSVVSALPNVGGIDIFMGNVRADQKDSGEVQAIEFSTQPQLAESTLKEIAFEASVKHEAQHVTILHSTGTVEVGKVCMIVITGCKHRKQAYQSNIEIVERLKKEAAIWGKEITSDNATHWKVNTD